MTRTFLVAAILAAGLGLSAAPAGAAVSAGDAAPDFEGKEFIGVPAGTSLKGLNGKVVFIEIFRTW